jgi:serine/threonine protein kinase
MADSGLFSPKGRAMGRRELEAMGVDTKAYETKESAKRSKIKLSSVKPLEEPLTDTSDKKLTNIKVRLTKLKSTPVSEESPTLKLTRPFNLDDFNFRGKGTYGCVFTPPIPCVDETVNRTVAKQISKGKKFVSKVLTDNYDARDTMYDFIRFNNITKKAGEEAKKYGPGVTMDLGSEAYKCTLPEKYDLKPKCGDKFNASRYSLIIEDLGKTDMERPSDKTKTDLLDLTAKQLKRMVASNIFNLMSLHKDGYVHRDIKSANILIDLEGTPSFKIIDYDLLIKIGFSKEDIDKYYEYFDYYYFFPAEYHYLGYRIVDGTASTFTECFENHIAELYKFSPLTYNRIRQIVKSYSSSDRFSEGLDIIYDRNRVYLTDMSVILRNPDTISKDQQENIERLWVSLDYYMWAIAVYELIASLKEATTDATKKRELNTLLTGLEPYFHPLLSERKIGVRGFVIRK